MSKNVVQFPVINQRVQQNTNPLPETEEEVAERKRKFHENHIDFLAGEVIGQIIHMMAHEGFDLNKPEVEPNIYLMVDSLYSMLYKSLGYEHDLHDVALKHFKSKNLDNETLV